MAETPTFSMATIGERQNRDLNLRRQAAARSRYTTAKRFTIVGRAGAILIVALAPVVLVLVPAASNVLAAAAGGWLFVSRLVLIPQAQHLSVQGAALQDAYDRDIFGLEIRPGASASAEEIRNWSRKADLARFRDWYPSAAAGQLLWPDSVLICQRSNVVWSRRQQTIFAWILGVSGLLLFAAGVAAAMLLGFPLDEYLLTILMPSLPALLDAGELCREHARTASLLRELEVRIDELLGPETDVERADLNDVQERLLRIRRVGPHVPDLVYRILSTQYEADMRYAASMHSPGGSGPHAEDN